MSKGFTEMTVTELRGFLNEPDVMRKLDSMGITVTSKTRKPELIEIARRVNADIVTDRLADTPTGVDLTRDPSAMTTPIGTGAKSPVRMMLSERRIVRALRAAQSRYYGVNGRGMGAKHYPMRSNGYVPEMI